jgi:hypothetical protein
VVFVFKADNLGADELARGLGAIGPVSKIAVLGSALATRSSSSRMALA